MRYFCNVIGFCAVLFLLGCGSEEPQYLKHFVYDVKDNAVTLEAEFSSDMSFNTDLIVPVLEYGEVSMIANNDQYGFRLRTTLNMDALLDPEILSLSRTRKLPNQQPMSPYVETDLGRLRIRASDDVAASVYFGLEPDKFYLGSSVELNFIDEDFPAGLVMSQRIRDGRGRMLAVVSLYGPKLDDQGNLLAPGGLMVISNVSDLKRYLEENPGAGQKIKLKPETATWVNQKEFEKKLSQYKLMQLYQEKGKNAGYVD